MTLDKYSSKRNFVKTSEPRPEAAAGPDRKTSAQGRLYVIQKHLAGHLHYDLRLEGNGVLKSWAVPKGPSLDPTVKRLAVEVEDHPLEYAKFEGDIPEGEYGAGSVIVWDMGFYETDPPHADLEELMTKGSIKFHISGRKLKGEYALVRTKFSGSKPNWLLIKKKDREARPGSDIAVQEPYSVISGKDVRHRS